MDNSRSELDLAWRWRIALSLWFVSGLLVIGHYVLYPHKHNSLEPTTTATLHWWAREDMYSDPSNSGNAFFYLPQAAILYTPFIWGNGVLAPTLLRVINYSLFGWGVWRTCRLILQEKAASSFLWVSLFAIPASLASLRNGQFDLQLAGFLLLATADVAERRWWRAVFWLCYGFAVKPLAIVPLLLFGALYFPLWGRILVGLLVVAILPWLCGPWAYVDWQFYRLFETLGWAYRLHEERFSDLAGMLEMAGYRPPEPWMTVLRLFGSLACLGVGYWGQRRLSEERAAWLLGALAALYLVLFNPRTEACSFVYVSPFLATLTVYFWQGTTRRWVAVGMGLACLGLASDAIPTDLGVAAQFHMWLKPLCVCLSLIGFYVFLSRRAEAEKRPGMRAIIEDRPAAP